MSLKPKEPETEAGKKARQDYLKVVRQVIGEPDLDYTTLYERFVQNDWAAIKLDDAVAVAALKAGQSAKAVFTLLLQSPYVQHQVHIKQVVGAVMGRYVESTVRQALIQLQGRKVVVTSAQAKTQQAEPEY
ncbi:MAG: hypothetical protein AAFV72_23685 [Cyanobacteria bacterium J06635_1]